VTVPLRVVVGEDSFLVREGIVHGLGDDPSIAVVDVASDIDGLREVIARHAPDVVVTDIRMPPTKTDEGIRLAIELRETQPDVGVVVLSQHASPSHARTLFEDGGSRRAYLLKDSLVERGYLLEAVHSVAQGRPILDSRIVELIVGGRQTAIDDLTPRELEVLALVAGGRSNDAIAKELVLTRRAVERHINSIFSKLDLAESTAVNRRVLAALIYARTDLVEQ
jgi:DNA-binding NarL/FixJ family response regulator